MTSAEFLAMLQSTLDEIGGIAPFYVAPDDYYHALNQAQLIVLADLVHGEDAAWQMVRSLVVKETLTDGGTGVALANRCYDALALRITSTGRHVVVKDYQQFLAFNGITNYGFLQGTVLGDKLLTTPVGTQVDIYYLRFPLAISDSQTCELSPIVHLDVWQYALQILLHKDINSPVTEMIEAWRNRRDVFRKSRSSKKTEKDQTAQYEPAQIPYQPK